MTGVGARIVVLHFKEFPTGRHRVGARYLVLIEKELTSEVDAGKDFCTLSTVLMFGVHPAEVETLR